PRGRCAPAGSCRNLYHTKRPPLPARSDELDALEVVRRVRVERELVLDAAAEGVRRLGLAVGDEAAARRPAERADPVEQLLLVRVGGEALEEVALGPDRHEAAVDLDDRIPAEHR